MKFLVLALALVAAVAAEPAVFSYGAPFHHYGAYPFGAYPFRHAAAPVTYTTAAVAAPLAYSATPYHYGAAPLAYAAAAPVAYTTGHKVEATYEPVEQHGYQIVY